MQCSSKILLLPVQRFFVWQNDFEDVEQRHESRINEISATTWWRHRSNPKQIFRINLAQIPTAFIHCFPFDQKLTETNFINTGEASENYLQQCNWLQCSVDINLRRTQINHKNHQFFAAKWIPKWASLFNIILKTSTN